MFGGDDLGLVQTMHRALGSARALGHLRVGSEHLLLALAASDSVVSEILAGRGATARALREAVCTAAPRGAGVAADRVVLAVLGNDLDRLLDLPGTAVEGRRGAREPLLPVGAGRARWRCARLTPPLGIDAQASYEASLRLALARRERQHRREHLALVLVGLDPGVDWLLRHIGLDAKGLLADLSGAFPPPQRNPLLGIERRLGHRFRSRDLVRRYERTTGRRVLRGAALPGLVSA